MSKVMFKRKNTDEIKDLSVEDGSLIYNYETSETYMDYGNNRLSINKLPKTEKQKIYSSDDDVDTYSCGYINEKIDDIYSTQETETNKIWINGKPIYRKVVSFNLTDTGTPLSIDTGISDYDFAWINEGSSFMTSGTETLPVNWYYSSNEWARTSFRKTDNVIRFASPASLSAFTCYVELNYTKK